MPENRSKRSTRPAPPAGRPNTLGLDRARLVPLLDRLDFTWGPEDRGHNPPRRGFVRWPFRRETIELRLRHPGGSLATIRVACRNLSRTGMSVLHGAYVHPGTACTVLVPHPGPGAAPLEGRVVRCTHRSGLIHEVGIRFDRPIDVRRFIAQSPFSDAFCLESVDPSSLGGCVVYIDDSPSDHRIVRHLLRDTGVRLRAAETAREGLAMIEEGCDLILCGLRAADGPGLEVAKAARARGIRTPVIALVTEKTAPVRRAVIDVRADAVLQKPPQQALLLRAIGEFLIVRRDPPPPGRRG